jgi:predicted dehydrogenase
MSKLRIAVIGVGHLGKIHARLLRGVEGAELVGIADPVEAARTSVAADLKVPAFADHRPLHGQIDAAIIATPTRFHHAVAAELLHSGIHVLIEKPITPSVADAQELVALAERHSLVLQVGHVERFNPAFVAAQPHITDPKYIEVFRTAPYTCRSVDVGVVLDLMIHDLDLVLALAKSEVIAVDAFGSAVIGPNEDWAQARLTFQNGCVANLTASRVSPTAQRSLAAHWQGGSVNIDFAAKKASLLSHQPVLEEPMDILRASPAEQARLKERLFQDYLPLRELPVVDSNAILEEQRDFVASIRESRQPQVSGRDGLAALDAAERILTGIASHHWDGSSHGRIGPHYEERNGILAGPHWQRLPAGAFRRLAG